MRSFAACKNAGGFLVSEDSAKGKQDEIREIGLQRAFIIPSPPGYLGRAAAQNHQSTWIDADHLKELLEHSLCLEEKHSLWYNLKKNILKAAYARP